MGIVHTPFKEAMIWYIYAWSASFSLFPKPVSPCGRVVSDKIVTQSPVLGRKLIGKKNPL
jgi:hypothetical protein